MRKVSYDVIRIVNGWARTDDLVSAMEIEARLRGLRVVRQTPSEFALESCLELSSAHRTVSPQDPLFIRSYEVEVGTESKDARFLRYEVNGILRSVAYLSTCKVINRPSERGYAGTVFGNLVVDAVPVYGRTALATDLVRTEHFCSNRPVEELEVQDFGANSVSYNRSDEPLIGPFRYRKGSRFDDFADVIVVGTRYWCRQPLLCHQHSLAGRSISLMESAELVFGVVTWRISRVGVRNISIARLHPWPQASLLAPFVLEVAEALVDELIRV